MYYFNLPNFQIVGSSPEILVRLRSDLITLRPIAGTRPRGKNIKQDRKYELDLLSDEKETSEHLMLLDLGRNDVGKVAKKSTVSVTAKFIIEKYSHVMHLVSNVTGKLKKNISTIEALMAGFPAGTVSGAPKIRAMQIIDELESDVRGIYAGGIGYISPDGDMDTCIVLRTGIITKNKLYVQAGGGVVYDSDPELEYMETINKAKAVLNAAEIVLGNNL
jgi:anthranilate synthase component 1